MKIKMNKNELKNQNNEELDTSVIDSLEELVNSNETEDYEDLDIEDEVEDDVEEDDDDDIEFYDTESDIDNESNTKVNTKSNTKSNNDVDVAPIQSNKTGFDFDIKIGELRPEDFGVLWPHIQNVNETDINWNGMSLWIDDIYKGRYESKDKLDPEFVQQFAIKVSNILSVSKPFNKYNATLEAEAEGIRITVMHDSISQTGIAISIRKTPAIRKVTFQSAMATDYISEEAANFLSNAVKSKLNIIICGLPGVGKTEFIKYLTNYIKPSDRVITIEDTLELHYAKINPGKDCIEFKVTNNFSYTDAIKACLRLLPQWVLLSEARSKEVKYLLESASTGAKCITTLHTDDVKKIPNRVLNMIGDNSDNESTLDTIYQFFNIGVYIDKKITSNGIQRYISQIGVFSQDENGRHCKLILDNAEIVSKELPEDILKQFNRAGIEDPFKYTYIPF